MLKVLEVPDFHFDLSYVETNRKNGETVRNAAIKYSVDAIVVPGDFWNAPHINSEKGGIIEAKKIVESWIKIGIPVIFIYGTPSHEPAGSLQIFEEMGAVILQKDKPFILSNAVFFGVNELSKKQVQTEKKLTPEEAAAATMLEFEDRLLTIQALRSQHPDKIAYGLLHGVVSDARAENSTDHVRSSSSLLIHTELLERCDLNRWALGDIHLPWESRNISAGYAGSWGQTWGETNFIPAFNLVEIESVSSAPVVTRIPYGTPMRKKISKPLESYDPSIAYWLETQNPEDVDPAQMGGHSWSRKTVLVDQKISRRITNFDDEKSLFELAVLVDETLAESTEIKDRFSEIEKVIVKKTIDSKNVRVRSVKITGCKFFKGSPVEFDLDSLPFGLTQIDGADNGAGKSSLLGFCTPYPIIIGKDTSSGRPSAIKDFFDGQDSSIEKIVILNGVEHRHVITIKGAHTASPKTECYLTIDGEPSLDKGTFDEMLERCEFLYGNFADYILTTFYVQPLQGKTGSSLMGATFTEIRNLVQGIAGIDRSKEKEYSSKKIQEIKARLLSIESELHTRRQALVDPEEIIEQIQAIENQIVEIDANLAKIAEDGKLAAAELEIERQKNEKNTRITTLSAELNTLSTFDEAGLRSKKDEYSRVEKERQEYQLKSVRYKAEKDRQREEIQKIEDLNSRSQADYQRLVREDSDRIATNRRMMDGAKKLIDSYNDQIKTINKPCSKCGHLEADLAERIAEINLKIEAASKDLNLDLSPKVILIPELTPTPVFAPLEAPIFIEPEEKIDIASINHQLEQAIEAKGKISSIKADLELLGEYDPEVFYDLKKKVYEDLRIKYADVKESRGAAEMSLKNKKEELDRNILEKKSIDEVEKTIEKERESLTYWEKIEWLLAPNKIPAVELELVLDQIDSIATQNLTPYRDGRYTFRTSTQSATADKFNILIYDAVEGSERSFLQFSPGEKAFLNDAYVKSLLSIRQQKAAIQYSPVVYDESDEPIKPSRVAEFYRMQENFYSGKPVNVLIVSHQPDAKQFLSSNISIEELKK